MSKTAKNIGWLVVVCGSLLLIATGVRSCRKQTPQTQPMVQDTVQSITIEAIETPHDTLQEAPMTAQTPAKQEKVTATKAAKKEKQKKVEATPTVEAETEQTPALDDEKEEERFVIINLPIKPGGEDSLAIAEAEISADTEELLAPEIATRKRKRLLGVPIPDINLKPQKRMERGIVETLFVPKGYWSGGMNISYTEHSNDNYEFLFLKDWSGSGHSFQFSPFVSYFYRDNRSVGVRFIYKRTLLKIDKLSLDFGDDLSLTLNDVYNLEQVYSGTIFHRAYIGLGSGKRFGLFNETRFTFGGGQGKMVSGMVPSVQGTYQDIFEFQVGIKPGLCVFILDNMAVEAAIGVLGFKYRRVDQIFNQVKVGSRSTSSANFKIDLFSISMGMSLYL